MALLKPDRYFERITHINVRKDLLSHGLTHVLLDIDNTIRSRDTHTVPEDVARWLDEAREAGVTLGLLSNSWQDNAYEFAASLGLPMVAKAMKPLPAGYIKACKMIGGTRKNTVVIGDQISTDIIGAHAVGMKAFLVQPLSTTDLAHMVVIRKLEKQIVGSMPLE